MANKSNCCRTHGDIPSLRSVILQGSEKFELRAGADSPAIPISAGCIAVTSFWINSFGYAFVKQKLGILHFTPNNICKNHQRKTCNKGEGCHWVHICRELWPVILKSLHTVQSKAIHISPFVGDQLCPAQQKQKFQLLQKPADASVPSSPYLLILPGSPSHVSPGLLPTPGILEGAPAQGLLSQVPRAPSPPPPPPLSALMMPLAHASMFPQQVQLASPQQPQVPPKRPQTPLCQLQAPPRQTRTLLLQTGAIQQQKYQSPQFTPSFGFASLVNMSCSAAPPPAVPSAGVDKRLVAQGMPDQMATASLLEAASAPLPARTASNLAAFLELEMCGMPQPTYEVPVEEDMLQFTPESLLPPGLLESLEAPQLHVSPQVRRQRRKSISKPCQPAEEADESGPQISRKFSDSGASPGPSEGESSDEDHTLQSPKPCQVHHETWDQKMKASRGKFRNLRSGTLLGVQITQGPGDKISFSAGRGRPLEA